MVFILSNIASDYSENYWQNTVRVGHSATASEDVVTKTQDESGIYAGVGTWVERVTGKKRAFSEVVENQTDEYKEVTNKKPRLEKNIASTYVADEKELDSEKAHKEIEIKAGQKRTEDFVKRNEEVEIKRTQAAKDQESIRQILIREELKRSKEQNSVGTKEAKFSFVEMVRNQERTGMIPGVRIKD